MKNVFLIVATASVLIFLATLVSVVDSNEKITKVQFQYLLFSSLSFFIVRFLDKRYEIYLTNLEEKNKDLERRKKEKYNRFKKIENAKKVLFSYIEFVESNPLLMNEIRNESSLPYPKSEIIEAFEIIKKEEPILKKVIPLTFISDLAFYRNDVPIEGYTSALNKTKNVDSKLISDIADELSEDSFPRDLYYKCVAEKIEIEKGFNN